MNNIISIPELSKRTGIKATELGRLSEIGYYEVSITKNGVKDKKKIYKGIVKGFRKSEKGKDVGFINREDMSKICIFYIYKNTKKIENLLEFTDIFNQMYSEKGPKRILNDLGKDFNDIENLYLVFEKSRDRDDQLNIFEKIISLLGVEKSEIMNIEDHEYNKITTGNEIRSINFTSDFIKTNIIKEYKNIFNTYLNEYILKITYYNLSSEINKSTSNYNLDKNKYNSKLLKPYKDYFLFLEKKITGMSPNYMSEIENFKKILDEFKKQSEVIFKENLVKMEEILNNIDFFKISVLLDEIELKINSLSKEQKLFIDFQQGEHNYFGMFLYIDEVLDFYNSKYGKELNEVFKIHNLFKSILRYFDYFIPGYNKNTIDDIKNNIIKYLRRPMKCLGYDYEFEYHLVHDAYEILNNKSIKEQINISEDKIIDVIQQMLSHGSFFINSNYHDTLLKKAIKTNNPKAIKILNGYLEGISEDELLTVCYDYTDTSKMMIPTLNCIEDMDIKTCYKAIYEGEYELLDLLYEKKKVKLISEPFAIEMYICIKGKNSAKCFEVIMKHLEKNCSKEKFEELKMNFIQISAQWGNEDIIKYNMNFLKSLPSFSLVKILSYLLSSNLVHFFKTLFSTEKFDPTVFLFDFLTNDNILFSNINKETWEYMFDDPFKKIDVNRKVRRPNSYSYEHEESIAGRVKERLHFSLKNEIFLNKLLEESNIFKDAFKTVKNMIISDKTKNGSFICYLGIQSNRNEIEDWSMFLGD